MTRLRSIATVLCATLLAGCGEEAAQVITGPLTGASIKFFNFAVTASPATTPGVNFFADDAKVTGLNSTSCTPATNPPKPECESTGIESTNGTTYGGVGAGGLYSRVTPGQRTFAAKIASATDNGLTIASLSSTVGDGKFYSFYTSGVYNTTTKQAEAFIVEDAFPQQPDFTVAYVRFVNASYNSSPMTLYLKNSLDATLPEIVIGGPVTYKSGGAFVAVPSGQYELYARNTGSTTNTIVRNGTAVVGFGNGRSYTVSARGDITVSSTGTATNRAFLDVTANR